MAGKAPSVERKVPIHNDHAGVGNHAHKRPVLHLGRVDQVHDAFAAVDVITVGGFKRSLRVSASSSQACINSVLLGNSGIWQHGGRFVFSSGFGVSALGERERQEKGRVVACWCILCVLRRVEEYSNLQVEMTQGS